MGVDAEQTHWSIHTNFVRLTQRVPMVQVKNFLEAMQFQVVGVPRAWVRLFQILARVVVFYQDQHPPSPQAQSLGVFFLYDRVVYFGGSEAPLLYMTLMYYDTTFWTYILMKNNYDDRLVFYYMCKCVCECFIIYETNSNLVNNLHMNQQLD